MIRTSVCNTAVIKIFITNCEVQQETTTQYADFTVHITFLRETQQVRAECKGKCVRLWECVMQTERLLRPSPHSLTPVQNVGSLGYSTMTPAVGGVWLKEMFEWED